MALQPAPLAAALSDDLTGTLGLSILIANENIPVRALTAAEDSYNPVDDEGRVVVINTNSRDLSEADARAAVSSLIHRLPPATSIVKRFDTTLRGHLGAELAAIMELRPQAAALIVPSYPMSGRLCIGGYQQVNGVPVERTEAARDPIWPISSSYVPGYFAAAVSPEKGSGKVEHISLEELSGGEGPLHSRLRELIRPGAVVVADAYNDGDIAMIARAAVPLERELIFVSPGAFIGMALKIQCQQGGRRIVVAVIGSAAEQTRRQVSALEEKYAVRFLNLPISAIEEDSTDEAAQTFLDGWNPGETDVLVIRPEWKRADSSLQPLIASALARTARHVMDTLEVEIAGLILSGGETAMTVLDQLGAYSIRPEVELDSLVVGGILLDGALSGTKIVTKGGLAGGRSILLKTMTWFYRRSEYEK